MLETLNGSNTFAIWSCSEGQLNDGLKEKKKKDVSDLNYLPVSGKIKCSSRYDRNYLFDLEQILPTDSLELCFHFSLVCGTIPWKV